MSDQPDFFSVVHSQRAHRAFSDEPVPDELVERVLETATYAPSAENTQPWVFIVVRDSNARARIGELTHAEIRETVAEAWLSRASTRRATAWLKANQP